MNDRSWIYRDSPKGLRKMNYCNGVQSFINYILSNPRNISEYDIRCLCKRCKNKKFLNLYVVTMHFLQKSLWRDTCVGLHIENHMFLTRPW